MSTSSKNFLSDEQIKSFEEDGYLVVNFQLENSKLDKLIKDVDPHYPPEYKSSPVAPVRLQDAWQYLEEVRQLAVNENVLNSLRQLFGRKALPFQTLNFPRATQQKAHSDTIHFNTSPKGFMAGVWIALEDIDLDNGPLIYYPGSHRLPEYTMEDFSIALGEANYDQYEQAMQSIIKEKQLTPLYGTIKKGEALIWHSNLLHGGAALKDPSRSRHSQVTHYFFKGCKYYTPIESLGSDMQTRHPDWIPDNSPSFRNTPLGRKFSQKLNSLRRRWGRWGH